MTKGNNVIFFTKKPIPINVNNVKIRLRWTKNTSFFFFNIRALESETLLKRSQTKMFISFFVRDRFRNAYPSFRYARVSRLAQRSKRAARVLSQRSRRVYVFTFFFFTEQTTKNTRVFFLDVCTRAAHENCVKQPVAFFANVIDSA